MVGETPQHPPMGTDVPLWPSWLSLCTAQVYLLVLLRGSTTDVFLAVSWPADSVKGRHANTSIGMITLRHLYAVVEIDHHRRFLLLDDVDQRPHSPCICPFGGIACCSIAYCLHHPETRME